ncbi:hypothetical protein NUSPORA_01043 [Nucleospora cyclopteri]
MFMHSYNMIYYIIMLSCSSYKTSNLHEKQAKSELYTKRSISSNYNMKKFSNSKKLDKIIECLTSEFEQKLEEKTN